VERHAVGSRYWISVTWAFDMPRDVDDDAERTTQ